MKSKGMYLIAGVAILSLAATGVMKNSTPQDEKIANLEQRIAQLEALIAGSRPSEGKVHEKDRVISDTKDWAEGTKGWAQSGHELYPASTSDSVGIGTMSPTEQLDIFSSNSSARLKIYSSYGNVNNGITIGRSGNTSEANIQFFDNQTGALGAIGFDNSSPVDGMILATGGSDLTSNRKMVITSTGNVGIGTTTSPAEKLDVAEGKIRVSKGTAVFIIDPTGGTSVRLWTYDGALWTYIPITGPGASGFSDIAVGNLIAYGNVGIGTTSPDEKFEVEWVSGGTDVEVGRGTTDTDITFITLRNASGTKYYIYPNAAGNGLTVTATKP